MASKLKYVIFLKILRNFSAAREIMCQQTDVKRVKYKKLVSVKANTQTGIWIQLNYN